MKATTTILAAIFILSMNVLFASNDRAAVNSETNSFHASLAPSTPAEATFEDMDIPVALVGESISLAPLSPVEATFEDTVETVVSMPDICSLVPVTPAVADFETAE